jgi:hypothetical protein
VWEPIPGAELTVYRSSAEVDIDDPRITMLEHFLALARSGTAD